MADPLDFAKVGMQGVQASEADIPKAVTAGTNLYNVAASTAMSRMKLEQNKQELEHKSIDLMSKRLARVMTISDVKLRNQEIDRLAEFGAQNNIPLSEGFISVAKSPKYNGALQEALNNFDIKNIEGIMGARLKYNDMFGGDAPEVLEGINSLNTLYKTQREAQSAAANTAVEKEKLRRGDIETLRKEFNTSDTTKRTREVAETYNRMDSVLQSMGGLEELNKSKNETQKRVFDSSLLYIISKLSDPGSVVRESEVGYWEGLRPWVGKKWSEYVDGAFSTQGKFSPEQRAGLANLSKELVRGQVYSQDNYEAALKNYYETEGFSVPQGFGEFKDIRQKLSMPNFDDIDPTPEQMQKLSEGRTRIQNAMKEGRFQDVRKLNDALTNYANKIRRRK